MALHWDGHKEVWQPPYRDAPPEQVWGELYTSNAFLSAEHDLINTDKDSSNPSVVAALMVWSDSTHLTQFGQAKAWPIYAYLRNQSKYTQCKPSTRSAQVVGYIPPVSDYLLNFILSFNLAFSSLTPSPRRYKLLVSHHCQHSSLTAVVSFSMGSGSCYWTMTSWSLTTMVSLLTVQMASFIGYSPEYSPTLPITLRSA